MTTDPSLSSRQPGTRPTAVVTGGSGGIGAAICRRLAEDGYRVMVGYNSQVDRAEELVGELNETSRELGHGDDHLARQVAVTDRRSLDQLAADVETVFGALDLLVNCAGVTRPVPHDDMDALDDDVIDWIFATNCRGPFATIRALRPALAAAPDPVVVNISSVSAVTGQGSNVAYCASKAALDSITRSLARALGPQIRIVSVSPGWVRGEYADRMDPELLATQENATPLRRLATPQDVAAAVSVVAGTLTFTTGTVIPVDGGRPLGVI